MPKTNFQLFPCCCCFFFYCFIIYRYAHIAYSFLQHRKHFNQFHAAAYQLSYWHWKLCNKHKNNYLVFCITSFLWQAREDSHGCPWSASGILPWLLTESVCGELSQDGAKTSRMRWTGVADSCYSFSKHWLIIKFAVNLSEVVLFGFSNYN